MSTENAAWALIGLVFGVFGNYIFEGYGIKTRAAKLNKRRAKRRLAVLEVQYEVVTNLVRDPLGGLRYLLGRLLLVQLLWLAQSLTDYLLGLVSNGAWTLAVLHRTILPGADPEIVSNGANTASSLLGALVLVWTLRVGLNAYQQWKMVLDYDAYSVRIRSQMKELKDAAVGGIDGGSL